MYDTGLRIVEILPLKVRFVSRNFSIDTTDETVSGLVLVFLEYCINVQSKG